MRRSVTFEVNGATMKYDEITLELLRGEERTRNMIDFDLTLLRQGLYLKIPPIGYSPDPLNDTIKAIVKYYKGKIIRPAPPIQYTKEDEGRVF